jgi:hypothetical protein
MVPRSMTSCARSCMQVIAYHMRLLHSTCNNAVLVDENTVQILRDLEADIHMQTEAWMPNPRSFSGYVVVKNGRK